MTLEILIQSIAPLDQNAMEQAKIRQNQLTKPAGSLGRLEEISIQLAGITGDVRPQLIHKRVLVMAADHGVTVEEISAYPAEVTPQMVMNFLYGGAAINVLARAIGASVHVVDMGVNADLPPHPVLITKKIGRGTGNIVKEPAMSRADAISSILAGASVVDQLSVRGTDVLAIGDMGIGNTTPSAAIACTILGASIHDIVGRGTGVDDEGLARKRNAVSSALSLHLPNSEDAIDILAKVGGYEIGGLVGAILSAASHRIPVVLDGFITTAAALLAQLIAPESVAYMLPSHCSQESGHEIMLNHLGLTALFDYQFRLGEASGAAVALHSIDVAAKILDEMVTFSEAGVSTKDS